MPPAVLFGLVLATLYASAFHLVCGRRLWQWPLFWVAAVAGFFGGYAAGVLLGFEVVRVGVLPLAACTLGSTLLLGIAWFFSTPRLPAVLMRSDAESRHE
jgi:hypothetical protein